MKYFGAIVALSVLLFSLLFTSAPAAAGTNALPTPRGPASQFSTVDPPSTGESGPGCTLDPALVTVCTPPAGGWQTRANLPAALYGSGVASDGVYVYAAGGKDIDGSATIQLVRYNPQNNTWTTLTPLPFAISSPLAVYAQGKLYVIGGDNAGYPYNLVQIYNIATGVWSAGQVMPEARSQLGGGYWNGKIYAVAGFKTTSITSTQAQTWEYSISANTWTARTDLPAALAGPGSGVIDGHLYIAGGRISTGASLDTLYDYNIAANSWTTRAALPTVLNRPGSAVYRGRLWVFGGGDPFLADGSSDPTAPGAFAQTYIYNPAANSWAAGPTQTAARSIQGGAVVRNRIFAVGGYNNGAKNIVEVALQNPLRILIVYADIAGPKTLQARLMEQPGVGQVDLLNARSVVASAAQMGQYDLVVAFSNATWNNVALQGDAVADYLDAGGVLVGLNFSWNASYDLAGRWITGGYTPFNAPGTNLFSDGWLGTTLPGHPLLAGVTTLNAFYRMNLSLAAGATQAAAWNSGQALVAFKNKAVGLSAYLGDNPSGKWNGDFAALIANAGYWLSAGNGKCTTLTCGAPVVLQGAITSDDPVAPGRLVRNEPASTCAAPTTCPGTSGTASYHYDTYALYNNSQAEQCITVAADAGSCVGTQYIQISTYTSFVPADLCANYLADIGGSPEPTKSYTFKIPANSPYTLVVNEVTPSAYCAAYTLQVSAAACPAIPVNRVMIPAVRK